MHFVSKKYANKSIKIYDMMEKELADIVSELENVKYYIEHLKRETENLERENVVKYDYRVFEDRFKDFKFSIESLESFRKYIKISNTNLKKALENDSLEDREVSVEDLQLLYNQTQFMISNLATAMENLKLVREDVDSLNFKAKEVVNHPDANYKIIYKIMESVYSYSKEVQIRIEQLSDTINFKTREGDLHNIIKADSILKANIDLKNKKQEKK